MPSKTSNSKPSSEPRAVRRRRARLLAARKQALRRRVADIGSGAMGKDFAADGQRMTVGDLPRFLSGLRAGFPKLRPVQGNPTATAVFNRDRLAELETLERAVEHLWSAGIRA